MGKLIRDTVLPILDNEILRRLGDSAIINLEGGGHLAFTTDSYVISPLFFPGGDIGRLAVSGTVNDLAMAGARPLALSLGMILEEGFPMEELLRVLESVRATAREAGVEVVTGDTKVVRKGEADGLFLNTSGIGMVPPGIETSGKRVVAGDALLVSGPVGDHGIAVMIQREGLRIESPIKSDVAPLWALVERLLGLGEAVHFLRDPTRGGLASALNELATSSAKGVELQETWIPVRPEVSSVCELLGLDPLYIACEGRCLAVVAGHRAQEALELLRGHPLGKQARIIGRVLEGPPGNVILRTAIGGSRLVQLPVGEQLPRIC
jgi:hydrogenase expression/formation protein HypE